MPTILHDSGGISPESLRNKLIYQSRTIEYYGKGRHEQKTKYSTLWTDTNYSGTGTWAGGQPTRWTCADGPFTFPNALIGLVGLSDTSDNRFEINGMVVRVGERFRNTNESAEGSLTVTAIGY